jgi:diguanylate cyclase (GGDEF)-like protein/PAS domain S-box-containing protein
MTIAALTHPGVTTRREHPAGLPSREALEFPTVQLVAALAATIGLVAWMLWTSAVTSRMHDALREDTHHNTELRDTIINVGERLTMSVHAAAATDDLLWEDQYDRLLRPLSSAFDEALTRVSEDVGKSVNETMIAASRDLNALDRRAFDAVHRGARAEASAILDGAEHVRLKSAFAEGVAILSKGLDDAIADAHRHIERILHLQLVVSILMCVVVLVAWAGVTRTLVRWRDRTAESEARANRLSEATLEGILIHDDQVILDANRAFVEMVGFDLDVLSGRPVGDLVLDDTHRIVADMFSAESDGFFEATLSHADGTLVQAEMRTRKFDWAARSVFLTAVRDISERKRSEAKIRRLAHFDSLTGLPNRVLFRERLQHTLAIARRHAEQVAVLFIDLDRFKDVNDILGHAAGDQLLTKAAARIDDHMRESDTLARLGGDEFAVIMSNPADVDGAATCAQRIIDALSMPFDLDDQEAIIGASVGIAFSGFSGCADQDALLRCADLALYRAKSEGRGVFRFFAEDMNARLQSRKSMELDLRRALADGQLELYYQPQVELSSSRVMGMEALLRWEHPEHGPVPTKTFITLAEETGLIIPLGQWVLRTACREALNWGGLRVAVNVSAAQFRLPGLSDMVAMALAETGLEPSRLELEITESILLEDTDVNLATLRKIKDLGVSIAMDDFGTGYSSLSYLRRFPFDKIKIDGSFVRDMERVDDASAIVRAVVHLGQDLGMTTIAEGVESSMQADILAMQGCQQVQGYYFGRPVPAGQVLQALAQYNEPSHRPAASRACA